MEDYIKRKDAITELRKRVHRFTVADEIGCTGTVKWSEKVIYETSAMNGLMSIPAADVVERKKGCWYMQSTMFRTTLRCTNCQKPSEYQFNFCPNCGAEMGRETN